MTENNKRLSHKVPDWMSDVVHSNYTNPIPKPTIFSVTELIGCIKQSLQYRDPITFPKSQTVLDKWIFTRGRLFHTFFTNNIYYEFKRPFILNNITYHVVGHPDFIQGNDIYELKTIGGFLSPDKLPYDENVLQLQAYDTLNDLKFNKLFLVYVGMSDWCTIEVEKKDQTLFLLKNLQLLTKCLDEKRFPTPDEHSCHWCGKD